jgi:Leucine-rich repeat (LRR) protein
MCNTISKFLTDCASTLEKLIISRVTPGHRGDEELNLTLFKMLTEISPNMNKLTHLDLSYNKIKDESCPDLCNFLLCIPPSLQILNLTGADLKDKGLELLAKEFLGQPESYNLTELDLSSNRISTTNCSKLLA